MTLQDFKDNFYCKFETANNGITFTAKSTVYRKSDKSLVESVITNMNVQSTTDWLRDSHAPSSLIQWDTEKLIDEIKRGHMDYFALRGQISDFYPLNKEENPNIDNYYI
jgi:hypothetical protein